MAEEKAKIVVMMLDRVFQRGTGVLYKIMLSILGLMIYQTPLMGSERDSGEELKVFEQVIEVALTVPDPSWSIFISEIYLKDGQFMVISLLKKRSVMAAQIVTTVSDQVTVLALAGSVTHYILGKNWQWKNNEDYVFLEDREKIQALLSGATLIYRNENS